MKSARLVPKIRILIGAVVAIGPGKAALLAGIARTGSISAAAREMKMSYRRAWLLVEAMNSAFRRPLVETLTGGEGGGGARVTELGEEVLRRYRAMEFSAARSVAPELKRLSRLIAPARRGR
ncbi:MAG: LysR family transcriptional regulator [Betaproteobacteria bacterium]|nr:MAG: LysR family transcriptional regulator [Betaproteobacteria bacterium]